MNTTSKEERFLALVQRRQAELATHPIVVDNQYTKWWKEGNQSLAQVRDFFQQFYVFSVLFIPALTKRYAWADDDEQAKSIWSILVSELGASFSADGDPDGSKIRFKHAHRNWCKETGMLYGLKNEDFKTKYGTPETFFFCETLERLYGNRNATISLAAADIVESTWAYSSGFWGELREGLRHWDKKLSITPEPTFLKLHDEVEVHHAKFADEEFREAYMSTDIDEDLFVKSGKEMLDAIEVFWNGLNESRKIIAEMSIE